MELPLQDLFSTASTAKAKNQKIAGNRKYSHSYILQKRFTKFGLGGFLEKEVMDLFFSLIGEKRSLSGPLLEKFGSIANIVEAPVWELAAFPDMTLRVAILIKLARTFSEYYLKQKIKNKKIEMCLEDLKSFLINSMAHLHNEEFRVAFINGENNLIDVETIQQGTVNYVFVHPRQMIEKAFHHKASSLIFAHNHPAGKAKPSAADRDFTAQIIMAATSMDIKILDHLIISKDKIFSFKDSGLLGIGLPNVGLMHGF